MHRNLTYLRSSYSYIIANVIGVLFLALAPVAHATVKTITLSTKAQRICGVQITPPSFTRSMRLSLDNDDECNIDNTTLKTTGPACAYSTTNEDLSIVVFDVGRDYPKTLACQSAFSEDERRSGKQFLSDRMRAFDHYARSLNADELKNFTNIVGVSSSVRDARLVKNLYNGKTLVGVAYTLEWYQDRPGAGVYQIIRKIDARRLLYISYMFLSNEDVALNKYFGSLFAESSGASFEEAEGLNQRYRKQFQEYLAKELKRKDIQSNIKALNTMALTAW